MKTRILILLVITATFRLNTMAQDNDTYLWLEEVESEKSLDWVREQNALSAIAIGNGPEFDALKARYIEIYNDKDRILYPNTVGGYMYNFHKDENHVRGIWRRTKRATYLSQKYNWETVLDLDALSEKEGKKWVFAGAIWLQPAYNICLLQLSDGGTDENVVREFDVNKKAFVVGGFELPASKGSVAWINNNELLISRKFGDGSMTTSGYPRIVKRWKRGTDLSTATTVMEGPETLMGIWGYSSYINGAYQPFISKSASFYSKETYALKNGKLVKLNLPDDIQSQGLYKDELTYELNSAWTIGGTTHPQGSLVSVNYTKLLEGNLDVKLMYTPDAKSSINQVVTTKNILIVSLLQNVQTVLMEFKLIDNKWVSKKMDAPEFGMISIMDADKDKSGYFYQYSNYITPATLYYVDGKTTKTIQKQKSYFNADNLEVHQYEVKSKDGTTVPYFIVHKKDIVLDGKNPTLVYAYGGFNISVTPSYSSTIGAGWLEKGGVYVVANIRGGGEFGPAWHDAALREKRQNAYDDFYAVCENLIERKISSPRHMGAYGWSNGGLMAGVVTTQRPDLFNAVIIGAPLLDMKRYNKMLAGASWMAEYGNPDVPEDWEFIKKYSPYHNVFPNKKYPEVFFVTSTKDDRVHPAHARKMAAKMLEQGHPLYYYETIEGGHGASSTNDQAAFNQALMYTYLRMKLM